MNVSMMDSYNLAWKLAYSINGLTPASLTGDILDTYHQERHTIAQQLIEFDKAFSSMFSGKIGVSEDGISTLTHDEFMEVFRRGNGFTSGCGVEYPENLTVTRGFDEGTNPIEGTDFLSGILYPGRRLLNVRLVRHADGNKRDIQDGKLPTKLEPFSLFSHFLDFPSTGRFRVLCLASTDLLDPTGISAQALSALSKTISRFPKSLVEQVVVHPRLSRDFMWGDIPRAVKEHSEMSFYNGYELDDVYGTYGVDPEKGAVAIVRPDGYIGVIASLADVNRVERYLEGLIRTV